MGEVFEHAPWVTLSEVEPTPCKAKRLRLADWGSLPGIPASRDLRSAVTVYIYGNAWSRAPVFNPPWDERPAKQAYRRTPTEAHR